MNKKMKMYTKFRRILLILKFTFECDGLLNVTTKMNEWTKFCSSFVYYTHIKILDSFQYLLWIKCTSFYNTFYGPVNGKV